MAVAFIEKNESDKYLSVFDYVNAYIDGDCKSNLQFLSTSLLSYIPNNAFQDYINLESVILPNAKFINEFAFDGCISLTYVDVSQVSQIGSSAFNNCNSLECIKADKCISINQSAFYNCYNLSEYIFGDVNYIGDYAFYNCSQIEVIQFDNCTTLPAHAFDGCINLSIFSAYNCITVNSNALANCTNLRVLSLPNAIRLYSGALYGCSNLISVYLNAIGDYNSLPCDYVFEGCNNLDAIYLPSITKVNSSIITSLYKIVLSNLTSINDAELNYTSIFNISHIELPNLITIDSITKRSPFVNVSCLKADNLISIGVSVFSDCNVLSYIDLPNLKYIGGYIGRVGSNCSYINLPKVESYFSNTPMISTISYTALKNNFDYINLDGLKVAQNPNRQANVINPLIYVNYNTIITSIYLNSLEHIDQYNDMGIYCNWSNRSGNGFIKNLYLDGIKSIYKNATNSSTNYYDGECCIENLYLRNCLIITNIYDANNIPFFEPTCIFNTGYMYGSTKYTNYYLDECLEFNFYKYYSNGNRYNTISLYTGSIYAPKLETIYAYFVGDGMFSFNAPNIKYGMLAFSYPRLSNLNIPLFEGSSVYIFMASNLSEITIKGSSETYLYVDQCLSLHTVNILGSYMKSIFLFNVDIYNLNCPNLETCTGITIYKGGASQIGIQKLSFPNLITMESHIVLSSVYTIKEFYAPKFDQLPYAPSSTFYKNVESLTTGLISASTSIFYFSKLKYFSASRLKYISDMYIRFNSSIQFINVQNIEYIGSRTFSGLSNISIMNIPKCSFIGSYAFYNCSKLDTVILDSCERINTYAFGNCSSLKFLMLPKCSYIENSAFRSTPIELLELGYGSVLSYTMFSRYSNIIIKVPASLYSAYQADSNWTALSSRGIFIVSS